MLNLKIMKILYKKIIYSLFFMFWVFSYSQTNAWFLDVLSQIFGWGWTSIKWPEVWCGWLPWCKSSGTFSPEKFLVKSIDIFIQIVAVLAVFALILSWIMYVISAWDEEKAKKAKTWILWSLVWVFVSFWSWWIISLLNNINF